MSEYDRQLHGDTGTNALPWVLLAILGILILALTAQQKSRRIEQQKEFEFKCVAAGGEVLYARHGYVCVRPDAVIQL